MTTKTKLKTTFNFLTTKKFWIKVVVALFSTFVACLIFVYFYLAPRLNEGLVNLVLVHANELKEHDEAMRSLGGVEAKEVTIPLDSANLNAMFYRVKDSPYVILYSHGNAGNIDYRIDKIRTMIECGISVLAYDYRGYGKSTGVPTLRTIVEDGIGAYDFLLAKENYKPDQVVLYGESIGTGISTEIARKRDYRLLILESGFTSPENRAKDEYPFLHIYPSFLMMQPALDNLEYVRGKHRPLLLFAGQNDTIIPCAHSKRMFAEASEPKRLVIGPHSEHNDFSKDWNLYKTALDDFLKANLSVAKTAEPGHSTD